MRKISIPDFWDLIANAPQEIKDYIDKCKETPQSLEWHPEGDVCKHINIVYNRAKKTNDIDNAMAAFFHDLGKVDTTKPHPKKSGSWSAHGHENYSAKLVLKHSDWIKSYGANVEKVHSIVKEHMRVKYIDNMRPSKRKIMMDHPYFESIKIFSTFDNMLTLTDEEINL